MYNYIYWFIGGFEQLLTTEQYQTVEMWLCVAIPIIFTIAAVVSISWAIMGFFGSRR